MKKFASFLVIPIILFLFVTVIVAQTPPTPPPAPPPGQEGFRPGPPNSTNAIPVRPSATPVIRGSTNTSSVYQSPVRMRSTNAPAKPIDGASNAVVNAQSNNAVPPAPTTVKTNAPSFAFPAFPAAEPDPTATNEIAKTQLLSANSGNGDTNTLAEQDFIPATAIQFQATPIDQVLDFYGTEITKKTVLKSPALGQAGAAQGTITLKLNTERTYTMEEAKQALDTTLAMNGIAMIPMGDKFILAVPSTQAMTEAAAFSTTDHSQLPEAAQYITEIVHLTNIAAADVVQQITPFAKLPNGITAIDGANMLVIRDYAINVKRMLEIIKKIDIAVESDYKLEVIPIKYGKVEDIYSVMSGLIGSSGGGASGTATGSSRQRSGSRSGSRSSSSSSRSSLNSRTGVNQTGQFGQQNQPVANPTANQNSFQQRLQQIVSKAAGGDSQILGDAKVLTDERSNSLVVYADKRDMSILTNIVAKLDVMLAQVLIEAAIIDITLGDSFKFGVSAQQSPKSSGQLTGAGGMANGASLLSGMSNVTSFANGPFTYYGKYGGDLDVAVSAMAANNSASVLQRPRVQTTHAQSARFFSGSTVPYITGTYYNSYSSGNNSSYSQMDVGIELNVTPFITPDDLVLMEISQTINELAGTTKIGNDEVPNTTKREAESTVSVRDNETIILGGFIRASKSKTRSGVPYLKDIPLLGFLFRESKNENNRSELIVLLRPRILRSPLDASQAAKDEMDRLPGVKQAQKDFDAEEKKISDKSDKSDKKSKK